MTSLSPRTASPLGSATERPTERQVRLARLIFLARASLTAERVLPGLWPALGFAGVYIAVALLGLYAFIPWTVQALLLAASITAIGLSLDGGFAGFGLPNWKDGARRLEEKSGLKHRPISEGQDRLIGDDPFARELWRLHQARTLAFEKLRVGFPAPDLAGRDPRHLRYGVLLLVAASLVVAGGDWHTRLLRAFDSGAGMAVTLDAWVDPPAYTGVPPIYLAPGESAVIAVPAGSVLNLRAHNASHAPGLSLGSALGLSAPPRFNGDNGEYSDTARIVADARARVRAGGHVIGDWRLHAIADQPPMIAFDGVPSATERQAMKITFRASDDYGVTGAKLVVTPHGHASAPLSMDLPLPAGKKVTQTNFIDLTAHPYAGLMVDGHLEARDATGQIGKSRTITFRLPARVFTDPLARALIEQRQNLATSTDAASRRRVATALDAFAIAPEHFYADKPGLYMNLRAAYWGTRAARGPEDIAHVEDLLWQIAVSLEQNGLLDAAAELRRLQQAITQALAQHAPQDVIDQLLQKYGDAMQKYEQALANNPDQKKQQQMQDQNSKNITQKDIDDLLKEIQRLSQAGQREQAAQMMALLQNMMENLRMSQGGQGGKGGQSQQGKALNDAIQKFSDMMGKERSLLDKTMRQKNGSGDKGGTQALQQEQKALRDQLNATLQQMDPKARDKMGAAGQAMDQAMQALGQKNLDNAGNAEKNALTALRQGADALSKEAQGQNGKEQKDEADPLGRDRTGTGQSTKVPPVSDLARARTILQELRRRAGERGRPQQELDYYDRLLKEF